MGVFDCLALRQSRFPAVRVVTRAEGNSRGGTRAATMAGSTALASRDTSISLVCAVAESQTTRPNGPVVSLDAPPRSATIQRPAEISAIGPAGSPFGRGAPAGAEDHVAGRDLARAGAVGPVVAAERFDARSIGVNGEQLARVRGPGSFEQNPAVAQHVVGQNPSRYECQTLCLAARQGNDFDSGPLGGDPRINDAPIGNVQRTDALGIAEGNLPGGASLDSRFPDLPMAAAFTLPREQRLGSIEENRGVGGGVERGDQRPPLLAGNEGQGCPGWEAIPPGKPRLGIVARRGGEQVCRKGGRLPDARPNDGARQRDCRDKPIP